MHPETVRKKIATGMNSAALEIVSTLDAVGAQIPERTRKRATEKVRERRSFQNDNIEAQKAEAIGEIAIMAGTILKRIAERDREMIAEIVKEIAKEVKPEALVIAKCFLELETLRVVEQFSDGTNEFYPGMTFRGYRHEYESVIAGGKLVIVDLDAEHQARREAVSSGEYSANSFPRPKTHEYVATMSFTIGRAKFYAGRTYVLAPELFQADIRAGRLKISNPNIVVSDSSQSIPSEDIKETRERVSLGKRRS